MKPRNKAGQLTTAVLIVRYFLTAFHSPFAPSTILPIYVVVHMPILPFKLCDAAVASITAARKGKLGLCPEIPSLTLHYTYFLIPSFAPNINSICVPKDPPKNKVG